MKKETVTPKKAMEWLKRNINNRPLSPSTVKKYTSAMLDGAWVLNGDTIRFNENGDLIDGQHRLSACVQCNLPFETYVARDVPHKAFFTFDEGKRRSIGDVMATQGKKHYTTVAAALRCLFSYQTNGTLHIADALRPDQANALLAKNPGIEDATHDACNNGAKGMIPPGTLAFLMYVTYRSDFKKAKEFWDKVGTGEGLSKAEPAFVLRKKLIENLAASARLRPAALGALCVKAWNAHKAGEVIKQLKWIDGEKFPKIA